MRKFLFPLIAVVVLFSACVPVRAQEADLLTNAKMATVFVARYNSAGEFIGWGSGFFVDEGIVVTNKHVVEGGQYYKIFPTEADETVDLTCGKVISLADVKINLNDDAAYMRAYLNCPHGVVQFVDDDPSLGDALSVLGYPKRSSLAESLALSTTSGTVTGTTPDGWLTTDAYLHFGNSGGPVISNGKVAGVAVAKRTDAQGNYVTGYFVPASVVLRGLLYANNSTFGYTPQDRQKNPAYTQELFFGEANNPFNPLRPTQIATSGECRQSLGEGGEATGYGGCRCKSAYHADSTGTACIVGQQESEQSSSVSSTPVPPPPPSIPIPPPPQISTVTSLQKRICARVSKWFSGNERMRTRVNDRLQRRFGFTCSA